MSQTKSNKNLILFIAAMALLLVLYFYISKGSNEQSVNKNSQNILDNVLTNIVAPKKPKKKPTQHRSKSEQIEIAQPFMVDETDYRPFELDDLLDSADRNEKSAQAIFNYNNLLEITHVLNALRNETLSIDDISVDDIKYWVKVLIYDEYYRNAKYNNLDNTFDIAKLDEIDLSYLPSKDELSERMEKGYLKQLKDLVNISNQLNNNNKEKFLRGVSGFVKKRSESAKLFLEAKTSKYFKSEDYTLEQKIEFAKTIKETKDIYLINHAKGYFEHLQNDNPNNSEINQIIEYLEGTGI